MNSIKYIVPQKFVFILSAVASQKLPQTLQNIIILLAFSDRVLAAGQLKCKIYSELTTAHRLRAL